MSISGGSWSGGGAGGEDDHLIDAANDPGDPNPGVDPADVGEPSVPEEDEPDETEVADAVIELEGDDDEAERG